MPAAPARHLAIEQVVDERARDVHRRHALQALPRGDAVDFDHERPVAQGDEVDAGVIHLQRRRGGHGQARNLGAGAGVQGLRLAAGAAGDVVHPVRADAAHRRDRVPARHEHAPVVPRMGQGLDIALQVGQAAMERGVRAAQGGLDGQRDVHAVDAAEPELALALRAEQRLEHERTTGRALARDQALGDGERLGGPGGRGGDAGGMQQQAGHRLVDAALDGARIVVDRHAELAQRMQHTQPLGHLLEAAAGDAAHQHGVRQSVAEAGQHEAVPGLRGVDAAVGEIDAATRRAALAQRALQLARVPADAVGHDGHARAAAAAHGVIHAARSRSMRRPPVCQVRPDSRWLTQTSAGANSAPSSL